MSRIIAWHASTVTACNIAISNWHFWYIANQKESKCRLLILRLNFNIACEENIDNNIHEGPSILTPQEDKNSHPLLT